MVTTDEEAQAKEFLKRAEIRTMKKDLAALREVDAVKERDKIVKIKTLEEQLAASASLNAQATVAETEKREDKEKMEQVLTKGEGQERIAEKDLKTYAMEEERQQIFLLESQRLGFEKQVDAIDKEKDPALKLEKNKLLLQKRDQQDKLNVILEQEKSLESEQKAIVEKEQTTTAPVEKKGLEQSRWDLDKKIQDIEKKRWAVEKEIEDVDAKLAQIDKSSEQLVFEKNGLRDKILGTDKSLREIYSVIMAREEEKRKGQTQEQVAQREALAKSRAEQKENVQRQQWTGASTSAPKIPLDIPVPTPLRSKMAKSFQAEEEARKKFMQKVEQGSQGSAQQKSNIQ
ncbi:MAG: hypothetical protein NTW11_04120 [Candidatus Staskawiczbacteria bacterium]|nr:hypothetical protein [Candidatus Staskawiczbacteria bacterium]